MFIAASLAHCPHALTQALTGSHRLASVLLGCPKQAAGYGRGATGVLGLLEGASERRAEVVTLALVLAAYEDATGKHFWRHVDPATARYLQFLTDAGYIPLSRRAPRQRRAAPGSRRGRIARSEPGQGARSDLSRPVRTPPGEHGTR